jgi:N4-gp56 family major capsid protein
MAQYLDGMAQSTLLTASSMLWGYYRNPAGSITNVSPYDLGTAGTSTNSLTGGFYLSPSAIRDVGEALATKNVPRIGETYVGFVHPHQSRHLREMPEWIEVTKYASPGWKRINFALAA